MPVRRNPWKPRAWTWISYSPGCRTGSCQRPPASVMRLWAAPVSTLRISTAALGIAAPDGSVTVPCKYAPTVCGKTAAEAASKAISSAEDFTRYPPLRRSPHRLRDMGAGDNDYGGAQKRARSGFLYVTATRTARRSLHVPPGFSLSLYLICGWLSARFQPEPLRAIAQDLRFPGVTCRIHGMRSRRWDSPRQVKKDRGRVFVGGDWIPESHIAEMLERVGERVVCGITGAPQTVAFGELLGRKCGETQQVIRSVFDHIDRKIVAREDLK